MAKRLAALPTESAKDKRQRFDEPGRTVSFDSLNNDCVVNILSYLTSDDMNSFEECSQDCRKDSRKQANLYWK